MDKLFKIEEFTPAVDALLAKNFLQALDLFKQVLESVFLQEIDSPEVLNLILTRISICQLQLGKDAELEETLKELFLINLSDPEAPSEVVFKSVFNLMVYY